MQKKKNEITLLNVLMCLMVMFIHVTSEALSIRDVNPATWLVLFVPWRLFAIVVPGFIMLSGIKLFLKGTDGFSAIRFYKKRALSIVLPYLLWVVIYYIYYCSTGVMTFSFRELIYYIYSGDLAGHFYFVIALLQFYLLMPLWVWLFRKFSPVIILTASIFISIIFGQFLPNLIDMMIPDYFFRYYDRTFTSYLFWWCLGGYIGLNYDGFKETLKKNTGFIFFLLLVSIFFDLIGSVLFFKYDRPQSWLDTTHMMYTFSALLFLMRAGIYYSDSKLASLGIIKKLDSASYLIYLTHCLTLAEVTRWLDKFGVNGLIHRYAIRIVLVYGITISLCIIYKQLRYSRISKNRRAV